MAQPTVRSFQPFIDYAPPVRAGRRLCRRERWAASLRRLATGAVLLATAVGAFALAHADGLGGAGALLAARGRRAPLLAALVAVMGLFALLLRIASLFGLTFFILVALWCADPGQRPREAGLLLLLLALIPTTLELVRAGLLWGLARLSPIERLEVRIFAEKLFKTITYNTSLGYFCIHKL